MATPAALKALEDTTQALRDIRRKVQPLLDTLRRNNDDDHSAHDVAVAKAGVALTLGTLRFLAQRLRGHKVAAPLRGELNRMRQTLVQVQKKATAAASTSIPVKRKEDEKETTPDATTTSSAKTSSPLTPPAKRRRKK